MIVDGDASFLRQAVDELLHTAGHGGCIGLNLRPEGPSVVLAITQGQPRKTSAAPGAGVPGTALGLTFIRAVAEAHGGDLALNDSTDPVDTLTVRLPTIVGSR